MGFAWSSIQGLLSYDQLLPNFILRKTRFHFCFHTENPEISCNPVVVRHINHRLCMVEHQVMTSFSRILINMHFSIFIEQKLFEYKIMIKITDNPDVIKIDDHGLLHGPA